MDAMLQVFNTRDLQNINSILVTFIKAGKSIEDLYTAVGFTLSERAADNVVKRAGAKKHPVKEVMCPECKVPMERVINPEGLTLYGCRICRYSKIDNIIKKEK